MTLGRHFILFYFCINHNGLASIGYRYCIDQDLVTFYFHPLTPPHVSAQQYYEICEDSNPPHPATSAVWCFYLFLPLWPGRPGLRQLRGPGSSH